jgi:hypothetical protein
MNKDDEKILKFIKDDCESLQREMGDREKIVIAQWKNCYDEERGWGDVEEEFHVETPIKNVESMICIPLKNYPNIVAMIDEYDGKNVVHRKI